MDGFPETVTLAQMQAACKALGLPLDATRTVTMDVSDGLTVTAYLTDDGQPLGHGDEPVHLHLHLPVAQDENGEQPAPARQPRVVLDVTGGDADMVHLIKPWIRRRGA